MQRTFLDLTFFSPIRAVTLLIMRIGIDLGGTKIEAAAVDDAGEVWARSRVATPTRYGTTLSAICQLVGDVEQRSGPAAAVGIGTPGAISPANGLMFNADNTALGNRPFLQDITRALGRPVRLANDAHCFALSEAVDGAGAGARVVFGVIVGTGCGAGIVVDGQLLQGVNAVSGEWGHNPLPWPRAGELPGPACYCGRRGCIEAYLSGPGLSLDHARASGDRLPADVIAAKAAAGIRECVRTLARYADRMARALAAVINLLDPDVVVLGGGVSGIAALYDMVPERWGEYVFAPQVVTRLLPNQHGDAGGVRGAAWLWPTDGASSAASSRDPGGIRRALCR